MVQEHPRESCICSARKCARNCCCAVCSLPFAPLAVCSECAVPLSKLSSPLVHDFVLAVRWLKNRGWWRNVSLESTRVGISGAGLGATGALASQRTKLEQNLPRQKDAKSLKMSQVSKLFRQIRQRQQNVEKVMKKFQNMKNCMFLHRFPSHCQGTMDPMDWQWLNLWHLEIWDGYGWLKHLVLAFLPVSTCTSLVLQRAFGIPRFQYLYSLEIILHHWTASLKFTSH